MPDGFEPFYDGENGVRWYSRDDGDSVSYLGEQDVAPLLEQNAVARDTGRGWTKDKSMAPVASIPAMLQLKCITEEGWDPLSADPGCRKKLWERLNGEWAHLRTSEWKLGVLRGIGA